ncbi:MAG: response regulator [Planctomycetes bacterium]|nr:response regulator [Planctomycetota bacterium]
MAASRGLLEDRRILIVDDDPDIRESVEVAFRSEGAQTLTCGDGNSAVRLALEEKPDAVILDMMLPGRSGFLVIEKIKGYEDSPVIVMITANEGKRHKDFAQGLGADLYLQKPMSLPHLVEETSNLLERESKVRKSGSKKSAAGSKRAKAAKSEDPEEEKAD